MTRLMAMLVAVALGAVTVAARGGSIVAPDRLVTVTADLSDPSKLKTQWTLDGSGVWSIRDGLLVLDKAGEPSGPIRRPGALAILQTPLLTDATIEVELQSSAPVDVKYRDLLLVAGYQSPTRFYYVHLSAVRDDVHNGIFLVDNADRRRIDERSETLALTDREWHRARLVRTVETGKLEVFLDDEKTPIMVATDRTLTTGRMGVGSFDDTGAFRNVVVTGTSAER
ncbi:MAG TPA: hypothetical protein VIL35_16250 [Vicinamibacterales bacterium]